MARKNYQYGVKRAVKKAGLTKESFSKVYRWAQRSVGQWMQDLRNTGLGNARVKKTDNDQDGKLVQLFVSWDKKFKASQKPVAKVTAPETAAPPKTAVESAKPPTSTVTPERVPRPVPAAQKKERMLVNLESGVYWLWSCMLTHSHVSWPMALTHFEQQNHVLEHARNLEVMLDEYPDEVFKYFKECDGKHKAIVCFLMSLTEPNMSEKHSLRAISEHGLRIISCEVRESSEPFDEMFREGHSNGKVGDGVFAPFDMRQEQKFYWLVTESTHEQYPLPRQQSKRAHKRR